MKLGLFNPSASKFFFFLAKHCSGPSSAPSSVKWKEALPTWNALIFTSPCEFQHLSAASRTKLSGKGQGRLDAAQPPSPPCEEGPARGWLLLVSSLSNASRPLWVKGFLLERSACLNTSYQFTFYWKVPVILLNGRDQYWSLKFVRMVNHLYSHLDSVPLKINVDILTPIP